MFLYNKLFGSSTPATTTNTTEPAQEEKEKETPSDDSSWAIVDEDLDVHSVGDSHGDIDDLRSATSATSGWLYVDSDHALTGSTVSSLHPDDDLESLSSARSAQLARLDPELRALVLKREMLKLWRRSEHSTCASEVRKKREMVHWQPSYPKHRNYLPQTQKREGAALVSRRRKV